MKAMDSEGLPLSKSCLGKFYNDRTCEYCHTTTQELHISCQRLNRAIIIAAKRLDKRKKELLEGCPHRHWVLGHDREEYWGCKAKPEGMYDGECDKCVLEVFNGED